ncbi:hypothetical protein D1007_53213 [Hordeum vulgare]|nr:hypothetical protein D1007_53213 [Hordeum vulgare]
MRFGPSSLPFLVAIEAFQSADLVNVEVEHAQSRRTDLVGGHATPTVALLTNASSRKQQGNIVVQGGIPDILAGTEVASGTPGAARSAQPPTGKMSKVSEVRRNKVPTKKPSSTPSVPARRSPTVTFYDAASTAGKVFDERVGRSGLNNIVAEFVN